MPTAEEVFGDQVGGTIVFAPGPLYLFFTTGVYYLWELSKSYHIVLLVSSDYLANDSFNRLCKHLKIEDVYCLPGRQSKFAPLNLLARFRKYNTLYRNILKTHRPAIILQYTHMYLENLWLFRVARELEPKIKRVLYLSSRMPLDWHYDRDAVRETKIDQFSEKHAINRSLSRFIVKARHRLSVALSYYVIPFLNCGLWAAPVFDEFSGDVFAEVYNRYLDCVLVYDTIDIRSYQGIGIARDKVIVVQHPLESGGEECNTFLHGRQDSSGVLLLPTYGFVNLLAKEEHLLKEEAIDRIASAWQDAIGILKSKFPGQRIRIKMHPNAVTDVYWNGILARVVRAHRDVEVIPPGQYAEKYILESRVVVSDVSTVLWWSRFFREKVSISLDLFGYRVGPEMKFLDNVFYFCELNELSRCDFGAPRDTGSRKTFPSVLTMLKRDLRQSLARELSE